MGYDEHFLGDTVFVPKLSAAQKTDTTRTGTEHDYLLHHAGYSVAMCTSRRMAWFSSANLDSALRVPILRKKLRTYWKTEPEISPAALTRQPWYRASKKLLQRGHLTPADVMEWGENEAAAIERANSTFYYSNAVPQVPRLNGAEWRLLEAYIGAEAGKAGHFRLSIHTGPVLADDDPVYVPRPEGDATLRIPRLFWKVVYYRNPANKLCHVGFLMSQAQLLRESGLVITPAAERAVLPVEGPFAELGKQKTYQVNVSMIEQLTGLQFSGAREVYRNDQPQELILREIDLRERFVPMFQQGVVLPAAKGKQSLQFMIGLEL